MRGANAIIPVVSDAALVWQFLPARDVAYVRTTCAEASRTCQESLLRRIAASRSVAAPKIVAALEVRGPRQLRMVDRVVESAAAWRVLRLGRGPGELPVAVPASASSVDVRAVVLFMPERKVIISLEARDSFVTWSRAALDYTPLQANVPERIGTVNDECVWPFAWAKIAPLLKESVPISTLQKETWWEINVDHSGMLRVSKVKYIYGQRYLDCHSIYLTKDGFKTEYVPPDEPDSELYQFECHADGQTDVLLKTQYKAWAGWDSAQTLRAGQLGVVPVSLPAPWLRDTAPWL